MTPLIYLKECVSTNDEIVGYFTLNQNEITAVYTFNQTKGRGQYGNSWETSANQNLAFSICIPKNQVNSQNNLFNYHTAVILQSFFANMTKAEVKLKWPNDIIIKNKKIAGVLIEAKKIDNQEVFIIGIGVNVLQNDFKNLQKAGSILTQAGVHLDLHFLAESLFDYLKNNINKQIQLEKSVEKFNDYLFRKDEISVFEIKGIRQNGIIKNADAEGFLWIDLENDGLQKFYHKEIELLY